jgi:hypothetical protein
MTLYKSLINYIKSKSRYNLVALALVVFILNLIANATYFIFNLFRKGVKILGVYFWFIVFTLVVAIMIYQFQRKALVIIPIVIFFSIILFYWQKPILHCLKFLKQLISLYLPMTILFLFYILIFTLRKLFPKKNYLIFRNTKKSLMVGVDKSYTPESFQNPW